MDVNTYVRVCVCAGCYNYVFRMQALNAIRDSGKTSQRLRLVKPSGYWTDILYSFTVNYHKYRGLDVLILFDDLICDLHYIVV